MPYAYVYQCDRCAADVEVELAREFRRDATGMLLDFEYPAEGVYQWPPQRVAGLASRLWCPACRQNQRWILVELPESAEHPVQAFLAAEAQRLTGAETGPCPECGAALLADLEGVACPACGEGKLQLIGEYEP